MLTAAATAAAVSPGSEYAAGLGSKTIFVQNASRTANAKTEIREDAELAAQRWVLEDRGADGYALRNVYSGLYLGYDGSRVGASVVQRSYSVLRSCWNLSEVAGQPGKYQIVPTKAETTCIGVESTADGTAVRLVDRATADPSLTAFTLNESTEPVAKEFNESVRDAMIDGFVNQYYHKAATGHVLGGGGWWGDAEMFETILDAFVTTGNPRYREMFDELYIDFTRRNGTDWSNNAFNDDITWMVLATARAYKYFGNATYLTVATDNYNRMYRRALQKFGTLIWKQDQENKLGTTSCINCPATVAACLLGELTGDKTWYDKAMSIYAGQRKLLFNAETGAVYDSGGWKADGTADGDGNRWVSTYNQGTMLGAATALYLHTGEEQYLQDADRVYAHTLGHLVNTDRIINVCQTINGDLCGFKGILMRYVRIYAEALGHEDALDWIAVNAFHARQNANSAGVTWSAWLTKTAEDLRRTEGDDVKDVSNDAFGASTAVSAAANAHINRVFTKDARTVLPADCFDDLKFVQLNAESVGTDAPTAKASAASAYLLFRNVDFGTDGATGAVLRLNSDKRSFAMIYADAIDDAHLLGRNAGLLPREWSDVPVQFAEKISGKHDIYVVLSSEGVEMQTMSFTYEEGGLSDPETADFNISGCPGGVEVETSAEGTFSIAGVAGQILAKQKLMPGRTTYLLPSGAYICTFVSLGGRSSKKIFIK